MRVLHRTNKVTVCNGFETSINGNRTERVYKKIRFNLYGKSGWCIIYSV